MDNITTVQELLKRSYTLLKHYESTQNNHQYLKELKHHRILKAQLETMIQRSRSINKVS